MRLPQSAPYAAGALALAAFVSACGRSPQPLPFARGVPAAGIPLLTGKLLYVGDAGTNDAYAYSYPKNKLVTTITGLNVPQGECVDKAGDVWITNAHANDILEYAHGGKTPIATLSDPFGRPIACSVDPTTGNLAVTNYIASSGENGGVSIYTHAQGTPKNHLDSSFKYYSFLAYDDKGNIFVDGVDGGSNFVFAELPKGKSGFKNITLNQSIGYPGNIQWDGKYVAVGDEDANIVYQTTGAAGTIAGSTPLGSAKTVGQFFIEGNTIIGPDFGNGTVEFWNYPAGGSPVKTIPGFSLPAGAAVGK